MFEKFYARIHNLPNIVAVFKSQKDRDDWLNYKDFSLLGIPIDGDYCFGRELITYEEADAMTFGKIEDDNTYVPDELFPETLSWCLG